MTIHMDIRTSVEIKEEFPSPVGVMPIHIRMIVAIYAIYLLFPSPVGVRSIQTVTASVIKEV